jgi:hypothetical protein
MSKQTLGILIIGLIVIVVGGYFAFMKKGDVQSLSTTTDETILLYVTSGDVSYKLPEQANFQKATTSPVVISNNTLVHTGKGTASVLFPNNSSVDLDEYTELKITYEGDATTLYQTLGTTYHRVEALVTGASYEVETPGTLAAVRGTKFAVKYDKKTKTTKVAVTEHKVEVAKFEGEDTASSTRKFIGKILLEEGKTARIDARVTATTSTDGGIVILETNTDIDMKAWVDKNQARDKQVEIIKEGNKTETEIRTELKSLIEADIRNEEVESKEETQPETKSEPRTETTKPSTTETTKPTNSTSDTGGTSGGTVVKINEEVFFDKFNTLFVNQFYLDDEDTPCKSSLAPGGRVRTVTAYAAESGYPFTSNTLLSFATAIDAYCLKKDPTIKAQLQARFDTEFPFNE